MNKKQKLIKQILYHKYIYLLLLPGVLYYVIFSYVPMYGITLAFKEFRINEGILGSPWVGLQNFEQIFRMPDFWNAFRNTLVISFQRLLFEFPAPIILALVLNEVSNNKLKRFYQTVFTFPNFLSWVVVSGILINLFGDSGIINNVLTMFGGEKQNVLMQPDAFRPLLYLSSIWKSAGWSAIIYLSAITSISPELYEAASVDGANRFQKVLHITWPGIRGTVCIMLILAVGGIMNAGFDQIFNLYNASTMEVGDIIDTYIYRRTFQLGSDFGSSTAVGLFKSVINLILLLTANLIVTRAGEEGLV